jgi:hypothetical protein
MANDRETCRECGHSWCVTMAPREDVLCSGCARPQPWKRPAHYWSARVSNFRGFDAVWPRSPEWWDAKTSLQELKYAAEIAADLPTNVPSVTPTPTPTRTVRRRRPARTVAVQEALL